MDALSGGEGGPEGGRLRVKEPPAEKRLHDRDAHVILLAQAVELRALGIYAAKAALVFPEQNFNILRCGPHVEGRIDAEHYHLYWHAGFN